MDTLNRLLLTPEVFFLIFIDFAIVVILTISFFYALYILKSYKSDTYTQLQYSLEKKSYLLSSIIHLSLYISFFMLIYFGYTINHLATLVPGAMCGAGVINANIYGVYLVALKFFLIIFALVWLQLNTKDLKNRSREYFKPKLLFFIFLYFGFVISFALELLYFTHIELQEPVLCCSNIYAQTKSSTLTQTFQKHIAVIFFFYTLLLLSLLYAKKKIAAIILSILYVPLSYYALTYFFSPYIYQLPTHKCPYCILESDYTFIGYFIYIFLIFATSNALSAALFNFEKKSLQASFLFYLLFLLSVTFHFFSYIIVNQKIFF